MYQVEQQIANVQQGVDELMAIDELINKSNRVRPAPRKLMLLPSTALVPA
jgi:hypothetical protein